MLDVLIAGGGPAGAVAAIVLARAGARVLLVDRDEFPRDKLCGDTLNPGAVAFLGQLGLGPGPLPGGVHLAGMRVSGPGVSVEARYAGVHGLAIGRRGLDAWLIEEAARAGARVETGWRVVGPLQEGPRAEGPVRGLVLRRRGTQHDTRMPASMVIGADGRRSVLARALGLASQPSGRRRWAFGTYASGVTSVDDLGEMHIRPWGYCGIAPVPGGQANVCVVTGPGPRGRSPLDVIVRALSEDASLRHRISGATFHDGVRVLGPLAVDVPVPGADGLLLAGDAAGFVDPMTGDGIHIAMRGGLLSAEECLRVLETGDFAGGPLRLAQARRLALGGKLRFDRLLRSLVGSPAAVRLAGWGAKLAPAVVRRAVRYAGDAA